MIIRLRFVLLSCLVLLSVCAKAATTPFSNMMVFGDSLSDIGNFPQSVTTFVPQDNVIAQNLYVPVTNPEQFQQGERYHIPNHSEISFYYPNLNPAFLAPPSLMNNQTRSYRSIGWSQYFLAMFYPNSSSHVITPWSENYNDPRPSLNVSVNYAWYSAKTIDGCSNVSYKAVSKGCTIQKILSARSAYQNNQPKIKERAVIVPGLLKQVDLFKHDYKTKRVATDDKTLYTILIGGNDLNSAFKNFKTLSVKKMWDAIKELAGNIADREGVAAQALIKSPAKAKHIVIFKMYNLGYSPEVYDQSFTAWIADQFTKILNWQISDRVSDLQKQYPNVDIRLYSLYDQMASQASSAYFSPSLGKACEQQGSYLTPQADRHNCAAENGKYGYLFWNNAHPSGLMEKVFAYGLRNVVLADRKTARLQQAAHLPNDELRSYQQFLKAYKQLQRKRAADKGA